MSTSLCEKLKRGCKRALSGLLAAATFASLLPEVIPISLAGDVENKPSALTVAVGDTYTVYNNGATASNLVQNGVARKKKAPVHPDRAKTVLSPLSQRLPE